MSEKIRAFFKKAGLSILLISIGTVIGMIVYAELCKTESILTRTTSTMAPHVTLDQVKIAYIPETEEIIFISRSKNVVELVLSKETTTAIYSLKASAMRDTYEAKKSDPTPAPSKRPVVSNQVRQPKK